MRRKTTSGKKEPNTRGELAEINKAITKAHEKIFGRYTYVDRLPRTKRKQI
jgi:hypothetical protein